MARCRPCLGTFVRIDCDLDGAIETGFDAIERVHSLMSAHEPDSEVSRLARARTGPAGAIDLSADTLAVIRRASHWAEASEGAFDAVRAGRESIARGAIPHHPGQPSPDPEADYRALQIDGTLAWFDRPAALDLGGIAKGYAVDVALGAMRAAGAKWAIVNAGGDLGAFGRPQEVAIPDPRTDQRIVTVMVDNGALATSAGYESGEGLDYGHLPGGSAHFLSVTVAAPRAIDADALTKAVFARPANIRDLMDSVGAKAMAITSGGEIVEP